MADQRAEPITVTFDNGRTAQVVHSARPVRPADLVAQLGLQTGGPVIVVIGGGDGLGADLVPRLSELFVRGLLGGAEDLGAVVVDGGTDSGVMAVMGQAVAEREHSTVLVGVAPAAKVGFPGRRADEGAVPLEPNHSHFVLSEGADWGAETKTMLALAEGLVAEPAKAVGVVVGGGRVARRELLEMVRRGWPVVVIAGTGGIADEAAEARGKHRPKAADERDPELAEIVADGHYDVVGLASDPMVLAGMLRRRLGRDHSLESAWELQAGLNQAALRRQHEFRRMQRAILGLAVLATLLAVTEGTLDASRVLEHHWLRQRVLRYALLVLPIAMTGAVGAAARFRPGTKWVVLRGSAEAVKREICRYRARCGPYGPAAQAGRELRLAERVGAISSSVMKTDVNLGAVEPYSGPLPPTDSVARGDDGFSVLGPEEYIQFRLQDQATWYRGKTVKLERRLRRVRWAGIGVGGLGAFLAAVGLELWIAVTTAVVAALATYLEYSQLESTLLHYNHASANLETIRRWWIALPDEDRVKRRSVNRLVEQSERILQSESAGWVQDMHDAMTELRSQQERADDEQAVSEGDASSADPPDGADDRDGHLAKARGAKRAVGRRPAAP